MNRECDQCGASYGAVRPSSRFCSDRCRKRFQRSGGRAEVVPMHARPPAGVHAAAERFLAVAEPTQTQAFVLRTLARRIDTLEGSNGLASMVGAMLACLRDIRSAHATPVPAGKVAGHE